MKRNNPESTSPLGEGNTFNSFLAVQKIRNDPDEYDLMKISRWIRLGFKIDTPGSDGYTLLLWAVRNNRAEIVESLLSLGANTEARDQYGNTALALASQAGNKELISTLLKANAVVDAPNNYGETPIAQAARVGFLSSIRVLQDAYEARAREIQNGAAEVKALRQNLNEAQHLHKQLEDDFKKMQQDICPKQALLKSKLSTPTSPTSRKQGNNPPNCN